MVFLGPPLSAGCAPACPSFLRPSSPFLWGSAAGSGKCSRQVFGGRFGFTEASRSEPSGNGIFQLINGSAPSEGGRQTRLVQ